MRALETGPTLPSGPAAVAAAFPPRAPIWAAGPARLVPERAARAAHRTLGNITRIREDIYDMNTLPIVDGLWQDLRYGARLLVKNPTFAVVAIVTLALGTGANAAIFQLVNALRLRAIPVERPEELVSIALSDGPVKKAAPTRRGKAHAPALNELADRLSDRFDTRVKVDIGRNKGRITIEFATVDDLERIVGMIGMDEEGAGGEE